jgi:hypothetical protein
MRLHGGALVRRGKRPDGHGAVWHSNISSARQAALALLTLHALRIGARRRSGGGPWFPGPSRSPAHRPPQPLAAGRDQTRGLTEHNAPRRGSAREHASLARRGSHVRGKSEGSCLLRTWRLSKRFPQQPVGRRPSFCGRGCRRQNAQLLRKIDAVQLSWSSGQAGGPSPRGQACPEFGWRCSFALLGFISCLFGEGRLAEHGAIERAVAYPGLRIWPDAGPWRARSRGPARECQGPPSLPQRGASGAALGITNQAIKAPGPWPANAARAQRSGCSSWPIRRILPQEGKFDQVTVGTVAKASCRWRAGLAAISQRPSRKGQGLPCVSMMWARLRAQSGAPTARAGTGFGICWLGPQRLDARFPRHGSDDVVHIAGQSVLSWPYSHQPSQ